MSGLPTIEGVTDLVEIGRGGFGVVYRGTETEFHRTVAVKVLMQTDAATAHRFQRERRAMGAVSGHPNIVTVYRGGLTESGEPYLVMEYLRGGSVSDRLERIGPYDWRTAAEIGAKLADALSVAHRAGILHRDVKPGNVFQTESGEPKLGDFGIARLDDGHDTRSGSITASIAHAPPEIIDGQKGDERSDLYSLASTIYAMTIGAAPFARDGDQGLARMLSRISTEDPPALHLESAADRFEAVLRQALSKRPEDRQASVSEFGAQLRQAATGTQPTPSPDSPTAPRPTVADVTVTAPTAKRQVSQAQVAVLALLALAIAGFGGWGIARAVFGSDSEVAEVADPQPVVTDVAEPTPGADEPDPAEEPTTDPTPTEIAATPAPTVRPTEVPPAPTALPGGSRGSGGLTGPTPLPAAATGGFVTLADPSGAISVVLPEAWTPAVETGDDPGFDDLELQFRGFAAGGTFAQLGGDPELRDLARSGITAIATRFDEPVGPAADILDVSLQFWQSCDFGDRAQIPLADGTADYQILSCARAGGNVTGVVVLALVPTDDPFVAVTLNLQFAEIEELSSLPVVIGSLAVDASKV